MTVLTNVVRVLQSALPEQLSFQLLDNLLSALVFVALLCQVVLDKLDILLTFEIIHIVLDNLVHIELRFSLSHTVSTTNGAGTVWQIATCRLDRIVL